MDGDEWDDVFASATKTAVTRLVSRFSLLRML